MNSLVKIYNCVKYQPKNAPKLPEGGSNYYDKNMLGKRTMKHG